ncbi:response regulator [Vibrio splendidus]|uniref:ATP-binding response regulator n=1 Tax=Vibrio splendidus TaxID=29497 RepID=UPI00352F05FF
MSGKPSYNISVPALRLSILFSIVLAALAFYLYFSWSKVDSVAQVQSAPLLIQAQKLNQTIEQDIQTLQQCLSNDTCGTNEFNLVNLKREIDEFRSLASLNKTEFSLVGATEYTQLELAINRFSDSAKARADVLDLYLSLTNNYLQMDDNYRTMFNNHASDLMSEKNEFFVWLFMVVVILAVITVLSNAVAMLKLKKSSSNEREIDYEFDALYQELKQLDLQRLEELLNEVSINPKQRQIYSHLKLIFSKLEDQKRNNDLYKQLYALIGYEIRGITNTINGGVQYLVQETDENGVLMAKDITSACSTLSELAENYNRLISQGTESKSKEFSLLSVLSELMIHISAKVQRNEGQLDCFISDNLPNRVEGQSTSLFWILFLQLSNAIQLKSNKKLFVTIESGAASDMENTRVTINLNFLSTLDVSVAKLNKLHWSSHKDHTASTDDLAKSVLKDYGYYESHWFQSGTQERFQIELDLKAKNFHTEKTRFDGKRLLLCANTQVRIDVMKKMLSNLGLDITDTFEPNKLPSLSKTVKSQLKNHPNTKLLLSVTNTQHAQECHSFVDKIINSPAIPYEFIPNLLTIMEAEASEEQMENSSFLIVEDDRVQQILLKRILTKQEYEPEMVGDGADAVKHFMNKRSDIIFMDCIMPGMGGIEATKRIRQFEQENEKNPCTIIGATALTSSNEHQACIEAGMDYVISKPYKSDQIIKVINKYVAVQKLN